MNTTWKRQCKCIHKYKLFVSVSGSICVVDNYVDFNKSRIVQSEADLNQVT